MKIVSKAATIVALFSVYAISAWNGITKTEPQTTSVNGRQFYQIGTPEELAWFADKVNSKDTAISAILISDIDLNLKEWNPIGETTSNAYDGIFDGNGHCISGINVSNKVYAGLFGVIDLGIVKNLTIGTSSIRGYFSANKSYVGGIAGYAKSGSLITNTTNNSVHLGPSSINSLSSYSELHLGGIVGLSAGSVLHSTNNANLAISSSISEYTRLGGVIGSFEGYTDSSYNLTNNASITGGFYTGGIVGKGNAYCRLIQMANYGVVSGDKYIGGICGYACKVKNSENKGKISINAATNYLYVGGVVGYYGSEEKSLNYGDIFVISDSSIYVGGIDGSPYSTTFAANYGEISATSKKGTAYTGGIAGTLSNNISSIYNQGNISSSHYAAGIVPYLPQNSVTIENFYVASKVIDAPYKAGAVYYNSVSATIKNGFIDKDLSPSLPAIEKNLGIQENVLLLTTSEMQTDSFAYFLDIKECEKNKYSTSSCYDTSFSPRNHWSRESNYPIFADSVHKPIYKISFINHQDTIRKYTNSQAFINDFPLEVSSNFIGWYKFGKWYITRADEILSNYLFGWVDSLVVAVYKEDEVLAQTDVGYCIDYILSFQKEYGESLRTYYEMNNMPWVKINADSAVSQYCQDENGDGILNWKDPSSSFSTSIDAMKKSLENVKNSLNEMTIVNSSKKKSIQINLNVANRTIQISSAPIGSDYIVFDMHGRVLKKGHIDSSNFNIAMPNAGCYLVKVGNQLRHIRVK